MDKAKEFRLGEYLLDVWDEEGAKVMNKQGIWENLDPHEQTIALRAMRTIFERMIGELGKR